MADEGGLTARSAAGRWVLAATVLGSGMAFLDATVVNVALPRIGEDLDAGITALQWTVNAYALTLAGLLLLGGALGDRHGRRRVFIVGVVVFAVASLACAAAPTAETLIAARAAQGVGAALLTPTSLAILEASFRPEDRAEAIGAWSGLSGVTTAVGPLVGGWMVQAVSWRLVFLINLPIAVAVVLIALRHVPESRDPGTEGTALDLTGAGLAAAALAGLTLGLTAGSGDGWGSALVVATLVAGLAALAGFVIRESTAAHPMVPPALFRNRQFTSANVVTVTVYAALGGALFLLPIQLQQVLGYSPLEAGAALLPITVIMLLFSARAGRLAQRVGPRVPMTLGPLLAGVGLLMLAPLDAGSGYLAGVLPGLTVFSAGLTLIVAPLTATVLGAAPVEQAGVASAVNTTVARTAGLFAVALVPPLAGITGDDYLDPGAFTDGYRIGTLICAALAIAGGLIALATIRRPTTPTPTEPITSCPLNAPPAPCLEADVPAPAAVREGMA